MTRAQIELVDHLFNVNGLIGDDVSLHDPFWGQMWAHAEQGADLMNDRGADFTVAQRALLLPYLIVRATEVLYFGEVLTDYPEELAERILVL